VFDHHDVGVRREQLLHQPPSVHVEHPLEEQQLAESKVSTPRLDLCDRRLFPLAETHVAHGGCEVCLPVEPPVFAEALEVLTEDFVQLPFGHAPRIFRYAYQWQCVRPVAILDSMERDRTTSNGQPKAADEL